MREAAANADVVITSGGVPVGEADFTKQLLQTFGDVAFWSLAMRPGRPLAGRVWSGERPGVGLPVLFFGLPGNPVAVMVTFYQIVREALLIMSGATPQPLPLIHAASRTIRKRVGRTEFQRGVAHSGRRRTMARHANRIAEFGRAEFDERSQLLHRARSRRR
ncbi:MAG: Molybdopterin molybdenumtransferase (EC [uncultured Paraburkholderia sp.]|nr:MAG: Molybdopterin molybdenumtransferase (EC [uncultured Paraburkholderia sp.]